MEEEKEAPYNLSSKMRIDDSKLKKFDFPPTADAIRLYFKCEECSNEIVLYDIECPASTFEHPKPGDLHDGTSHKTCSCKYCGHLYEVDLNNRYGAGIGTIKGLSENASVYVVEQESIDTICHEKIQDQYAHIVNQCDHADRMLQEIDPLIINEETRQYLYKLIYVSFIACMEEYLYFTLINLITLNEENKDAFGANEEKIRRKIEKELHSHGKSYEEVLKDILLKRTFHPTEEICGYYNIYGIDILKGISKKILDDATDIRNDIMHRNGLDIYNNIVSLSREDIDALKKEVLKLIGNVENQVIKYIRNLEIHD